MKKPYFFSQRIKSADRSILSNRQLRIRRNRNVSQETNWLDKWLPRLSHFSQFGLFLFTIGSIYFTVIPLYKNAALEEGIARKEAELKESEKKLERSYSRLRAYAISQFVMPAGAACTGLLIPPPPLAKLGEKKSNIVSLSEQVLSIDVSACLFKQLDKSAALNDLTDTDRQTLGNQVKQIAAHLDQKRRGALEEYRNIAQKAKHDPSVLPPLDSDSMKMLGLITLQRSVPEEKLKKYQFRYAVEEAQARISEDYADYARKQIASLKSLDWTVAK